MESFENVIDRKTEIYSVGVRIKIKLSKEIWNENNRTKW